jgi:hypothetical protein
VCGVFSTNFFCKRNVKNFRNLWLPFSCAITAKEIRNVTRLVDARTVPLWNQSGKHLLLKQNQRCVLHRSSTSFQIAKYETVGSEMWLTISVVSPLTILGVSFRQ